MASIQHLPIFCFQRLEPITKDLKLEQQRVPKFQQKVEESQVCSVLVTVARHFHRPTSLSVYMRAGTPVSVSVCMRADTHVSVSVCMRADTPVSVSVHAC